MRALLLWAYLLLCACNGGDDGAAQAIAADAEATPPAAAGDPLDIYEPSDTRVPGAVPPE